MFLFNEQEWVFRTRCSLVYRTRCSSSMNRSEYSGRDVPYQRTGVSIQDEMFLFKEQEWVFRTRCSSSTNMSEYSGRDVPYQRTGVSIQDEMFLFKEQEWVYRTRCSSSTNRSEYTGRDVPLQRTGVSIQDEMFLFNEQEWVMVAVFRLTLLWLQSSDWPCYGCSLQIDPAMVAVFRLTLLWLQADGTGEEGAGVQADGVEARPGTSVRRRCGEGQSVLHPSRGWQAAGQILRGGRTQGWAWNTHTVKSRTFVGIKICGFKHRTCLWTVEIKFLTKINHFTEQLNLDSSKSLKFIFRFLRSHFKVPNYFVRYSM